MADDADIPALDRSDAPRTRHLARLVLVNFIFTFVIARIMVILIMAGKLPSQLFFHLRGTHIHHLNYGIFLLSISGGYLLFARPIGSRLSAAAIAYGIGLGLTFDEFGMWLHLGGPYWQRASYDAVIVVGAVLSLIAFGTTIRQWRPRHFLTGVLLIIALCGFTCAMIKSLKWADQRILPMLIELEEKGPK